MNGCCCCCCCWRNVYLHATRTFRSLTFYFLTPATSKIILPSPFTLRCCSLFPRSIYVYITHSFSSPHVLVALPIAFLTLRCYLYITFICYIYVCISLFDLHLGVDIRIVYTHCCYLSTHVYVTLRYDLLRLQLVVTFPFTFVVPLRLHSTSLRYVVTFIPTARYVRIFATDLRWFCGCSLRLRWSCLRSSLPHFAIFSFSFYRTPTRSFTLFVCCGYFAAQRLYRLQWIGYGLDVVDHFDVWLRIFVRYLRFASFTFCCRFISRFCVPSFTFISFASSLTFTFTLRLRFATFVYVTFTLFTFTPYVYIFISCRCVCYLPLRWFTCVAPLFTSRIFIFLLPLFRHDVIPTRVRFTFTCVPHYLRRYLLTLCCYPFPIHSYFRLVHGALLLLSFLPFIPLVYIVVCCYILVVIYSHFRVEQCSGERLHLFYTSYILFLLYICCCYLENRWFGGWLVFVVVTFTPTFYFHYIYLVIPLFICLFIYIVIAISFICYNYSLHLHSPFVIPLVVGGDPSGRLTFHFSPLWVGRCGTFTFYTALITRILPFTHFTHTHYPGRSHLHYLGALTFTPVTLPTPLSHKFTHLVVSILPFRSLPHTIPLPLSVGMDPLFPFYLYIHTLHSSPYILWSGALDPRLFTLIHPHVHSHVGISLHIPPHSPRLQMGVVRCQPYIHTFPTILSLWRWRWKMEVGIPVIPSFTFPLHSTFPTLPHILYRFFPWPQSLVH